MVESDTAQVSVLPLTGCEFSAVFLVKVALDVVGLGVDPLCLRLDSEETLPALIDERAEMSCTVPGVTPDGGPVKGASVLEPIEHSGKAPGWLSARADACAGTVRAFGSGDCMDRWTFGGDACSGAVRAFGSRKVLAREAHGRGASFRAVGAFGSEKACGRWITGGKIGRGLVCTTHHGTVRAFGSGDNCSMGAIGTFKLCCDRSHGH